VYAFGPDRSTPRERIPRQAKHIRLGQYTRRIGESALSFRYTHFDWSDKGAGTGGFVLSGAGVDSTTSYHQLYSSFRGVLSAKLVNDLSSAADGRLSVEKRTARRPEIVVLDAFTGGGSQVNTNRNGQPPGTRGHDFVVHGVSSEGGNQCSGVQ